MTNFIEALYEFYDDFLKGYAFSCTAGCSTCCTTNIVTTTMEVDYLMEKAGNRVRDALREIDFDDTFGYRPSISINESASYYLKEKYPPEDTGVHIKGICPLLSQEGLCSVYQFRPFSCRAMTSTKPCDPGEGAEMDPFLITVNLSVQQIIEHVDSKGFTGNLWDVVNYHETKAPINLIKNRPFPGFLIPPQERGRFLAFTRRLKKRTGIELMLQTP